MKDKVIQRAQEIAVGLVGFNKDEALAILSASIFIVATGEEPEKDIRPKTGYPNNPNLIRRRKGGVSPLDNDPELKAYILGLDRYLSIVKIHKRLVEKFGKNRIPSRSSIHRFLQRVTQAK